MKKKMLIKSLHYQHTLKRMQKKFGVGGVEPWMQDYWPDILPGRLSGVRRRREGRGNFKGGGAATTTPIYFLIKKKK